VQLQRYLLQEDLIENSLRDQGLVIQTMPANWELLFRRDAFLGPVGNGCFKLFAFSVQEVKCILYMSQINSLLSKIFLFFLCFMGFVFNFSCICVHLHATHSTNVVARGQLLEIDFFPFTTRVLGIEFRFRFGSNGF